MAAGREPAPCLACAGPNGPAGTAAVATTGGSNAFTSKGVQSPFQGIRTPSALGNSFLCRYTKVWLLERKRPAQPTALGETSFICELLHLTLFTVGFLLPSPLDMWEALQI